MQPSTGLLNPLLKAQSWQLTLPWVLNVRFCPEFVPTIPCLVHMLAAVVPLAERAVQAVHVEPRTSEWYRWPVGPLGLRPCSITFPISGRSRFAETMML